MSENLYTPNCLRTHSGKYINLLDPSPADIDINDIAIGLSRAPRFAGQTKQFYSVAVHSVWCVAEVEKAFPNNPYLSLKVLLHDAHEYLLCDIPSPVKNLIPEYVAVAELLQAAIDKRFGLTYSISDREIIKAIDKKALQWEWDNKVLANTFTGLSDTPSGYADHFLNHFHCLQFEIKC